jgi:hypothetical protein
MASHRSQRPARTILVGCTGWYWFHSTLATQLGIGAAVQEVKATSPLQPAFALKTGPC